MIFSIASSSCSITMGGHEGEANDYAVLRHCGRDNGSYEYACVQCKLTAVRAFTVSRTKSGIMGDSVRQCRSALSEFFVRMTGKLP